MGPFDPFTASASDLQALLSAGEFNSSTVVEVYLKRIAADNGYLRSVVQITLRDVLDREIKRLDEERASGKVRGPLHGIPFLVKDNVATDPSLGIGTTAGSLALVGSRPHRNAPVIQRLLDAGGILLGKASLSELNFYRSEGIPCAWSAVSGQSQSAYVRGGFRDDDTFGGYSNPGGSLSGSAIAVSAGFAPAAIGIETIRSLMMPADRAALYLIKPTVGTVSQEGIYPVSSLCDAAGPMTKTTKDLADLLDIILDPEKAYIPEGGFSTMLTKTWQGTKIGFLEPDKWMHSEGVVKYEKSTIDQMLAEIGDVYTKLAELTETRPVILISWDEAADKGNKVIDKCFDRDYSAALEKYLGDLDNSKVYSLSELIKFNKDHADLELPPRYDNQNGLIRAQKSNMTDDEYKEVLNHGRRSCRELGIDKALKDNNVDVLLGPADGPLFYIAGVAAYPIASLPLGYLEFNGRPFRLVALALAN